MLTDIPHAVLLLKLRSWEQLF